MGSGAFVGGHEERSWGVGISTVLINIVFNEFTRKTIYPTMSDRLVCKYRLTPHNVSGIQKNAFESEQAVCGSCLYDELCLLLLSFTR